MSVDLFGVETEGPRNSPATTAPPRLISAGGPRRAVRIPAPLGSLAERLGLTIRTLDDRTADERRRDRDRWLSRIYAAPPMTVTVADLIMTSRESLNFWGLAQKHTQRSLADLVADVWASGRQGSIREALGLLIGALTQTACSFPRSEKTACSSEGFPDAYLQRDVYQAQLNDRARVLAQTQAEFPPSGKFKDIRYLRAIVRNRNVELYAVRSAMRKCGQRRHTKGGVVAYAIPGKDGRDHVSLSGIIRCGSVHSCPRCAPRISQARAELLKRIVVQHRETGGGLYMLTLTVPHSAQMPIRTLRRAVAAAWQLTQQGAPWRRLKTRMGFVGSVASREVTHGGNGWHPHLHILLATRAPIPADELRRLGDDIYERWRSAVARQDVTTIAPPSRERGVHLQAQDDATYIERLGLADELLGAIHKVGRDGNRTPFEIMADYARQKNARDAGILRPYHRGIKGARQLTWSRGKSTERTCPRTVKDPAHRCGPYDLRCIYPLGGDSAQLALLDGEDLNTAQLEAADKKGVPVAAIPGPQWDALARVMRAARSDAEAELVQAIEEHGAAGVQVVLESAYRVGVQLAQKRRRLKRWLWWLDPRRRTAHDEVLSILRR